MRGGSPTDWPQSREASTSLKEAGLRQSCCEGELLLLQRPTGTTEAAEDVFRQALDIARQQEALSWELRAATSLARLLRNQRRPADAIVCLRPIYDRFTEGFGTADLVAAKQLLNELSHGRQQRPAPDS